MRSFACRVCAAPVAFEALHCERCAVELAYVPSRRDVRPLVALDAPGQWSVAGEPGTWWPCLNRAWGCNWALPSDTGDQWCASCRLTRGRPDLAIPDAVDAWSSAERAKRRVLDQLTTLGLGAPPVFDLLYVPDGAGVTGYRNDVVTLDLREVDDEHRDRLRRRFGEAERTVIGHLRHEMGHHYWGTLIERTGRIEQFRALFGDERTDYGAALDAHYELIGLMHDEQYVSRYAASHPSEDWAETFARYLQLRDELETAAEHGILGPVVDRGGITHLLTAWRRLRRGLDELAHGSGRRARPAWVAGGTADAKIALVHECVLASATALTTAAPPRH